jgi:Cu(I)/Ag(I) efflux system membrane fusion protein
MLFVRRFGSPIASAMATAVVFTAALWVQHARGTWPFDNPASEPPAQSMIGTAATSGTDTAHGRVPVDAAAARSLDIRLETAGREVLTQTIRAVAIVAPDESRISHVHTRVAGWVEQLFVNTTGEVVRAGQPLARIFSQELFSSQVEYLSARQNAATWGITTAVVASGRTRLSVLGMSPAEIDAIEQSGEPRRLVTVVAPRSGVVVNRGVTVGASVDPSTTLLTIADLSRVWVLAEVPEANIAALRAGAPAQLEFPASGRPPARARVEFLYPTLTEGTRTLRVRFSVANPGGVLRPGLFGTAMFEFAGESVITAPRSAIVDTGRQQHVFVAAGNRFEPRAVTVGVQLADRVEIRDGLQEGEQIVVSGVFLLDSESRLRATGGTGGHNHGSGATRQPPSPSVQPDPHAGHQMPEKPPADPHAGHRN